jgi:hypothetical protein
MQNGRVRGLVIGAASKRWRGGKDGSMAIGHKPVFDKGVGAANVMGAPKRQSSRERRSNKSVKRPCLVEIAGGNTRKGKKQGEEQGETVVDEEIDVTPCPSPQKKGEMVPGWIQSYC